MATAEAAAARPRGRYSHPRSVIPSASNSMSVTSCAASVLKIVRVLVRLECIASFIVNANHEVSTEPREVRAARHRWQARRPSASGALAQRVANKHSGSFERSALSALSDLATALIGFVYDCFQCKQTQSASHRRAQRNAFRRRDA